MILALLFFKNSSAQDNHGKPIFISVQVGGYLFEEERIGEVYNSTMFPIFGAVAGFPFGKRLYLYGKLLYSSKNSADENEIDVWITNVGLKYSFLVRESLAIELSGGFARAGVKEKTRNSNGTYGTSEGIGIFGGFYGIGGEKKFSNIPISISAEISRNASVKNLKALITELDGTSFTIGVRYYLPAPKKQPRP